MYLMVQPSIYHLVKKAADASETSVNDFMCRLLSYHFRNDCDSSIHDSCPPESYRKLLCRMKFNAAVASGRIKRQPCAVCGAFPTEGHHTDYSKPFDVVFLCRQHHHQRHALDRVVTDSADEHSGWLFPELASIPLHIVRKAT